MVGFAGRECLIPNEFYEVWERYSAHPVSSMPLVGYVPLPPHQRRVEHKGCQADVPLAAPLFWLYIPRMFWRSSRGRRGDNSPSKVRDLHSRVLRIKLMACWRKKGAADGQAD